MLRGHALVAGEVYHIYNRGAHKQAIFTSERDYERFMLLLYLANTREPVQLGNLLTKYRGRSSMEIFDDVVFGERLVDVLAYALMPNHFHLVLKQRSDEAITLFMRKVSTAYSMYFNTKYEHSGVLFQGRFKSSHVGDEAYFRYIFSYVHLNPVGIVNPDWETAGIRDADAVRKFLKTYRYSSYPDYSVGIRPETKLLAMQETPDFLKEQDDLADLLHWGLQPDFIEDRPQ